MANGIDGEINGCIFQWKILNISHCWWLRTGQRIESPPFIVDELEGTKWSLWLYPMGEDDEDYVGIYLHRKEDCGGPDDIEVTFEIAFLNKDVSLINEHILSYSFEKNEYEGFTAFEEKNKIFISEREEFLPEDTLTVQCTLWNTHEIHAKSNHIFADTVIKVKRRSFLCRIDKISILGSGMINKIKDCLFCFYVILNEDFDGLEMHMTAFNDSIKYISCNTSVIDSEGKKKNCEIQKYFANHFKKGKISSTLFFPEMMLENKSRYFPNDVLSLDLEFVISTFEHSDCRKKAYKLQNEVAEKESQNTTVLSDDLKSMFNDGILSDTELRTSTKTFQAHRNILSARSSVFRRMFNSDTKEKNEGQVDITDLDEDTVHRMLLYIYAESLEDLQLESACKLYTAAIKYDIFSLKSKCSSFLKHNLCPTKACDVLILADEYQDNDLKSAVQDYILNHEDVFISKEWKNFMVTNIELAADIMYRKINTGKILPCSE